MTAHETQSLHPIPSNPTASTARTRASVRELKEIFAAAFRDHDTITIKEIYEALATRGKPCEVPHSGSRIYVALYELGYGKEGEVFRRKFARTAPLALRRIEVRPEPARPIASLPEPRLFEDGELRVRDIDLGAFLGFARPVKVRELIERHRANLEAFGTIPTVGTVAQNRLKVDESWLNEHQACWIVSKSDTERADAILRQIVDVFVRVRRAGQIAHQPQVAPQLDELLKLGRLLAPVVAPLLAELVKIAGSLNPPTERPTPSATTTTKTTSASKSTSAPKSSTGWFRTFEYLNRRSIASTSEQRKRLGTVASSLMKKEGLEPGKTTSARFGSVNTYPAHVLERAWSIAQTGAPVEKVA